MRNKLEEMEEEYLEHEVPDEIMSKLVDHFIFLINIDDVIDELHKDEVRCSKRLIVNDVKRGLKRIAGYFADVDSELVEREKKYLDDELEFVYDVMDYSSQIASATDDENYMELARLFDFMIMNYSETISSKESRLVGIERARNGIEFIDFRYRDKSKELREFMDNKLQMYQKHKELEKTK